MEAKGVAPTPAVPNSYISNEKFCPQRPSGGCLSSHSKSQIPGGQYRPASANGTHARSGLLRANRREALSLSSSVSQGIDLVCDIVGSLLKCFISLGFSRLICSPSLILKKQVIHRALYRQYSVIDTLGNTLDDVGICCLVQVFQSVVWVR